MGSTNLEPRAMLKAEAMDVPVQEVFDQKLVLAADVFKQTTNAETITYWLEQNHQGRGGKREPGAWDLGVDRWPEIRIGELDRDSVSLSGLAAKVVFSAKRLEFSESVIDLQDGVDLALRGFAEKFENDAFNTYTNTRELTDGAEFDATFSEGEGGYATTGGHLLYTPDSVGGKEWDNTGDPLQQLREMVTVFRTQGRIAGLDGEVNLSNRIRAYTDGLTMGVLHDRLRDAGLDPKEGSIPNAIRVPSVYNLEIVQADFAVANDGDMLLADIGSRPLVGYYHPYNRLASLGFRTISSESGFPLQVMDKDEDNGDVSVHIASGSVYALRKPKHVMLAHGLLQ